MVRLTRKELPTITRVLEDGLFWAKSAPGSDRYIMPLGLLPTQEITFADPVYVNDDLKWVADFIVRKPLYRDMMTAAKMARALKGDKVTSSIQVAATFSTIAAPLGYPEVVIDIADFAATVSQRNLQQINTIIEALNALPLNELEDPEATLLRNVKVYKPMGSHADILSSDEGFSEERMTRYLSEVISFEDIQPLGTFPALIANLTLRDFQALSQAINVASELSFPSLNN